MALQKKLKRSKATSSASPKIPPKKPKLSKSRPPEPPVSPIVEKIKARIEKTKADILSSTSSNPIETPPPVLTPAEDTELEKLRKKSEHKKKYERENYHKNIKGKKGKKARPEMSKAGVLALLRLPFQVGGSITGYTGEPINPAIEEPLAESAMQVLHDFGFEAVQKWVNLGVFAALYGTCGLGWFRGMQTWAQEQRRAALAQKEGKISDIPRADTPKSAEAV